MKKTTPAPSVGKRKTVEATSQRVARIAGRLLKRLEGYFETREIVMIEYGTAFTTVGDLRALAASALTQAPGRKQPTWGRDVTVKLKPNAKRKA